MVNYRLRLFLIGKKNTGYGMYMLTSRPVGKQNCYDIKNRLDGILCYYFFFIRGITWGWKGD
jgi:hypothetical protein